MQNESALLVTLASLLYCPLNTSKDEYREGFSGQTIFRYLQMATFDVLS